MQSTNLPSKYLVPFAKNDGAKVELPVTTATAGRASQSLGFPPITGQPPEAGGLPPQLEDLNGAMNQPARIAWWSQLGGKFPFDNTFATDANIGGYPLGSELVSSDNTGTWLSLADNNVANPDTVGTGWAPARAYGALALTGQTGGTVTPTPVQAMKRRITIAGALTSNLIVVLPNWLYSWDITNSTSGAFSVTVKTAAGAGVVVPQNGAPTPVVGDGTNIAQSANNIPAAASPTQALQLGQATGRLLAVRRFLSSTIYTPTSGTNSVMVEVVGGGGSGAGCPATSSGQVAVGSGGAGGGYACSYLTTGFSGAAIVVGLGGVAASGAGNAGSASSFNGTIVGAGGAGGAFQVTATFPITFNSATPGLGSGGNLLNSSGGQGFVPLLMNASNALSGGGGFSAFGAGAPQQPVNATGGAATTFGAGGAGGATANGPVQAGGAGGQGVVIVWEYS